MIIALNLVHIPKTAGSSIHIELTEKTLKSGGAFVDIFDLMIKRVQGKKPGSLTVEKLDKLRFQIAREQQQKFLWQREAKFFDSKFSKILVHHHMSGISPVKGSMLCQPRSFQKFNPIIINLRCPTGRTLSHFAHFLNNPGFMSDFMSFAEAQKYGMINLNPRSTKRFEKYEFVSLCHEIRSVWYYQIRYLLSLIIECDYQKKYDIVHNWSAEQVLDNFAKHAHKFSAQSTIGVSFLNRRGEVRFSSSAKKILDAFGVDNFKLKFHYRETKRTHLIEELKVDINELFSANLLEIMILFQVVGAI